MPERPAGDHVDHVLRRSMSNLAELAGPTPELSELDEVVRLEPVESERSSRLPVLALAALVIAVVGALWLFDRNEAAIEQDTFDDRTLAPSWSEYEASVSTDEWTACLVGWLADRDADLGISGDQFAASTEVARFSVPTRLARSWLDRHDKTIAILESVDDPLGATELRTKLDELEADIDMADPDGTVDIADVLTTGATLRPDRDGCPLADDRTPLHRDLVAYSGGDRTLRPAVMCADAVVRSRNDFVLGGALAASGPLASELGDLSISQVSAEQWLSQNQECPLLR